MNLPKKKLPPEIQKWISASEPDYLLNWCTLDYSKAAVARLAISFEIYELKKIQALWITLELARKEFLEIQKFEKAHLGTKELARKLARIRKNPNEFPALFLSRLPTHPSELEMAIHSASGMQSAISEMQENIADMISQRGDAISPSPEFTDNSEDSEEPPYVDDFHRIDPISAAFLYLHQRTGIEAMNPEFRKANNDLFPKKIIGGNSDFELPSLGSPKYQQYLCDLVEAHLQPVPFAKRNNIKRYVWTARFVNFCCDHLEFPYTRNKDKDGIPSRMESFIASSLSLRPLDDWQGVRNLIHRHNRKYWQDFSVNRLSNSEKAEPEKRV